MNETEFKCPLRGFTFRHPADKWVLKDGVLQCSYCGSIPPEEMQKDLARASNPFDRTHITSRDGNDITIHRARTKRARPRQVVFKGEHLQDGMSAGSLQTLLTMALKVSHSKKERGVV